MTNIHQPDQPEPRDEWVVAARTDRVAFGQLFDHFYPQILAYCMRRLLVRAWAEDVASEVFLSVTTQIHAFAGRRVEDFRRWLYRITTNEINAQLRQTIRRTELLEAAVRMGVVRADLSSPVLDCDAAILWEDVYEALGELSPREQSIISLRFFAGLKHEEIASILDAKPGAVRVGLSRALDKLRERLRDQELSPRTSRGVADEGI
jgi:RNA polymerase sigma-70 factor (ECF subfamily)